MSLHFIPDGPQFTIGHQMIEAIKKAIRFTDKYKENANGYGYVGFHNRNGILNIVSTNGQYMYVSPDFHTDIKEEFRTGLLAADCRKLISLYGGTKAKGYHTILFTLGTDKDREFGLVRAITNTQEAYFKALGYGDKLHYYPNLIGTVIPDIYPYYFDVPMTQFRTILNDVANAYEYADKDIKDQHPLSPIRIHTDATNLATFSMNHFSYKRTIPVVGKIPKHIYICSFDVRLLVKLMSSVKDNSTVRVGFKDSTTITEFSNRGDRYFLMPLFIR